MNTITLVMTVLTLWLVMGLGFLSKYVECKRDGRTTYQAWMTYEGLFFAASILIPILIAFYRVVAG
jgi:heme/copper-type cytochrome/quinol oxidase subunit 2